MGKSEPWWPEHDEILRRAYALNPAHKIAAVLGRGVSAVYQRAYKLGLEKPEGWASECTRERWKAGRHENSRRHQFRKGVPSWSKGTKGIVGVQPGCRATQFKTGERRGVAVKLYQPVGTERVSKDGYRERKVNDDLPLQARWRAVHLIRWEAINGRIPPGHALVFRDRNKANTDPENMELVSRADLMRRNTLHRYPPEVVKLVQLRGALNRKINRRSKA